MIEGNFADVAKIFIQSGNGGKGSSHLRREKYIAKGGPDGGDGGKGGDVIFRGNQNLWTLYHFKFKKHFRAEHGGHGGKSRSTGVNGKDIVVDIPLGTVIKNLETDEIIGEISKHEEKIIVLKGGKGGLGNWHFKSSVRQTPTYAQKGLLGEELQVILELKILADVGLVGFPNAGKSTLLATLSAAKPKIADYEFTTLKPNIGIVPYRDYRSFVMADIPGIIEKASEGKGLGHRFLRHIERNSVLLFMVPFREDKGIDVYVKNYNILLKELKAFNPDICKKEGIFALTKCDLIPTKTQELAIESDLKQKLNLPVVLISSHNSTGLMRLKDTLWSTLNE